MEGSHQSYYLPVAEGGAEPTEGDSERPASVRDSRPHPSTLQDISPKWELVSVRVCLFRPECVCVCVCQEKMRVKLAAGHPPPPKTVSFQTVCGVFYHEYAKQLEVTCKTQQLPGAN